MLEDEGRNYLVDISESFKVQNTLRSYNAIHHL